MYNGNNQLTGVEVDGKTVNYTYYPSGLRKSKNDGLAATTFILDSGYVVTEQTVVGGQTARANYIYGANLLASSASGGRQYYLHNGHGDVVQLTNTSGVAVKSYDYDAFGVEKTLDIADLNPFRYCGEYWDVETSTYYLRARSYSPGTGRFLSEDPIRDGTNWYAYCGGNPILWVDPSGYKSEYYLSIFSEPDDEHSFVVIENRSKNKITVGVYTLGSGQSVTIGTYGNKKWHNGIFYESVY